MTRRINLPDDPLQSSDGTVPDGRLIDFWRWAFSDLCDDDIKGIFAEWLVHRLLGVDSLRRISWSNSDLIAKNGVTIEVKATSYWQSWKLIDGDGRPRVEGRYSTPPDDSKIRFAGLIARDSTTVPDMSTPRQLKSQLYVFAFQHEKNPALWNAMDLSQWEFYVVAADELAGIARQSISLTRLRPNYGPLSASALIARAHSLIAQLGGAKSAP